MKKEKNMNNIDIAFDDAIKKIGILVILVFSLIVFALGVYTSYSFLGGVKPCHIDISELEDIYANFGLKTEFHELRFLSENMTLRQVKDLYQKTYPMSNGVLEWELTNLCD